MREGGGESKQTITIVIERVDSELAHPTHCGQFGHTWVIGREVCQVCGRSLTTRDEAE